MALWSALVIFGWQTLLSALASFDSKAADLIFLPLWLFVFLWLLLCGHDRDIGALFSANYLN